MNAVLFVGHGSREEGGNEEVRLFVSEIASKMQEQIVETCFLEFVQPTIMQGIDRCVELGATHIVVIPIILFAAGHAKIHIPSAMDDAKLKYPLVKFTYGRPIGVHEQILDILSSRVEDLGVQVKEDLGETALLIVGRGSSDADANSDLFKISRLFWEKLQVKWVETAFIGVTAPLMDAGIERCLLLGAKKVIILPYFLFTGVLIQRMEQMVQGYRETYPDKQFQMAPYFGFHPLLQEILIGRAQEALQDEVKMNCDMCQYRLEAMKHIDHHHHHDHDDHHHHDHDHDDHHHHDHDHKHDHDYDRDHDHEHKHDHDHHDHVHSSGDKR